MNVLCIGRSSWNISIPSNDFIKEGINNNYNKYYASGSGMASNVAYLLAKWGVRSTISSMVGSDDYGTKIKREFSDLGIKTDYIETTYDKETHLDISYINSTTKMRTLITVASELSLIKKYNYESTPDIVFTDCFDYGASQNAFSRYGNATTIVGATVASPEVLEMCKFSKIIICNREFAEHISGVKMDITNPQSLVDGYNRVQNKYPNAKIILSLDVNGAVYENNNEIKIMPGLNIEVNDKTGAGDAFKATFIYSLINNFDMDKSIIMANIAAGLTVSRFGSRMSFPSLSEVIDLYNQKMGLKQNTSAPAPQPTEPIQQPAPNAEQVVAPAAPTAPETPQNPNPPVGQA